MKNSRIYKIIIFIFLSISLSCSDDILDQDNPNKVDSSTYWTTAENLKRGVNTIYRALRFNGTYGRWYHVLYVSRCDEGYSLSPNTYFQAYSNFETGSYNDDNAEGVLFPWLDSYKGIFWANQVLDYAPDIEMDDSLKARIEGEAYFLRGVFYFNIAAIWGNGPLELTSKNTGEDSEITDQEGLYHQAISDFLNAEKLLSVDYGSDDVGRATKGGARGMAAKTYMQLKEWENAATYLEKVMNMKSSTGNILYELVSDYGDNFNATNENNSESIFEVQFAYGYDGDEPLGCQRPKFLGLHGDGIAWTDADVRDWTYEEFLIEKTTDGEVDPRLDYTLFYYGQDELYYGEPWDSWEVTQEEKYWKKYTNYATQTYEDYNSGINFRVLRLSDIYLSYAEVLNELGRTGESYEYINKVRNRAGLPNLEDTEVEEFQNIGTDQDKMRTQIMHERHCELCGECWRWMDLARWGYFYSQTKINKLAQVDEEFKNFEIGVSQLYPIPYREIGLVKGLEQNPGY